MPQFRREERRMMEFLRSQRRLERYRPKRRSPILSADRSDVPAAPVGRFPGPVTGLSGSCRTDQRRRLPFLSRKCRKGDTQIFATSTPGRAVAARRSHPVPKPFSVRTAYRCRRPHPSALCPDERIFIEKLQDGFQLAIRIFTHRTVHRSRFRIHVRELELHAGGWCQHHSPPHPGIGNATSDQLPTGNRGGGQAFVTKHGISYSTGLSRKSANEANGG